MLPSPSTSASSTSAWKSSIRRYVITEKAPTRAFSWLKAATTAFTFKTLLRHYAKRALTPRSLNVKLGLVGAFSVITNLRMEIFQALLVTASLTCVGPRPLLQTHGHVCITEVGSPRRVRGVAEETRRALHPLHHDFIWNKSELKLFSLMSTFVTSQVFFCQMAVTWTICRTRTFSFAICMFLHVLWMWCTGSVLF